MESPKSSTRSSKGLILSDLTNVEKGIMFVWQTGFGIIYEGQPASHIVVMDDGTMGYGWTPEGWEDDAPVCGIDNHMIVRIDPTRIVSKVRL